jgi:cell wall-associated NlpC family hydrolase
LATPNTRNIAHKIPKVSFISLNTQKMIVHKHLKVALLLAIPAMMTTTSCSFMRKSDDVVISTPKVGSRALTDSERQLRENIVGYAQNFTGTKYRSSGTKPSTGFDCSGFTHFAMKEYGVKISHGSSSQANEGRTIEVSEAQIGDLLFFGGRRSISHVGMVVSNDANGLVMIHSSTSQGIVVQNISKDEYWMNKLLFARDVLALRAPKNILKSASPTQEGKAEKKKKKRRRRR